MEARELIEDAQYMSALPALPNIPVIVISSMKTDATHSIADRQLWYNAHESLKTSLTDFSHTSTTLSGHYIMNTEPALVKRKVRELLANFHKYFKINKMIVMKEISNRQSYLDWLRILSVASVLFFHAAMPFVDEWNGAIRNSETSRLLLEFNFWLSRFRMPCIFFISGSVSYYMLKKSLVPHLSGCGSGDCWFLWYSACWLLFRRRCTWSSLRRV